MSLALYDTLNRLDGMGSRLRGRGDVMGARARACVRACMPLRADARVVRLSCHY